MPIIDSLNVIILNETMQINHCELNEMHHSHNLNIDQWLRIATWDHEQMNIGFFFAVVLFLSTFLYTKKMMIIGEWVQHTKDPQSLQPNYEYPFMHTVRHLIHTRNIVIQKANGNYAINGICKL